MRRTLPSETHGAFPVLSRFFAFWEDVEALRRQVGMRAGSGARVSVAAAREQLIDTLRRQQMSSGHAPGTMPSQLLEEAQYVMAATADELFIGLAWEGADGWIARPLEAELFGTRRAGEEIFARIDRLADGHGPVDTEMAAVYLAALELGFKGQFADSVDRATLDGYESRLRELLGRRPSETGPLVPACYHSTIAAGSGRRLPASRLWWSVAAAIAAIFVLAFVLTLTRFRGSPIEEARQRLETAFNQLTAQ
jgi:type VI secretion system protein ImpK